MFTPEQTAEMLQIAKSTLRKYAKLYGAHLSPAANRKQRNYTEDDIATLQRVVQLRADGVSLAELESQLVTVHPKETKPDNTLALIPGIATEFQSIHDQLAKAEQDRADMRAELDELRAELHNATTPWWKKLRKK